MEIKKQEQVKADIVSVRTEEVRDIIERMPTTFAGYITLVVCAILILLFLFGYLVSYPDVVSGELTISAQQAPLRLVVEQNGKLKLNQIKSQDNVKQGQILGWIENPAKPESVDEVKLVVGQIKLPTSDAGGLYNRLPKNLNLGDLTMPYSSFLSSVKLLADYQNNKLYDKQQKSLVKILDERKKGLRTLGEKETLNRKNLLITRKFLERDSILLSKKVISQGEFDQALSTTINSEDQFKSSLRNTGSVREQISETENSIQQNQIAKNEKEIQLYLDVVTSYNNLVDKINLWEKQYLIRSPLEGKVQFMKFWNENQFVQSGEPVFSIVPNKNNVLGLVNLPITGAGKVKVGQDVIVKLADYPYMEYGFIKAKVSNIALVSNTVDTDKGASYQIILKFPDGLLTNYGTFLDFRFESKGSAEIITKKRRLIERFFDNLKYIGHS